MNAVEHDCYGNACGDDVKEVPRKDESMHGDSTGFSACSADGVSAMADSVSSAAEEAGEAISIDGDWWSCRGTVCVSPCSSCQAECSQG